MTTHELFQEYFDARNVKEVLRPYIERPEIAQMEEKLGKPFIRFTADDFIELFTNIMGTRQSSYRSYIAFASYYRKIIGYYCEKYEPILNPFETDKLKGQKMYLALCKGLAVITIEDVETAIEGVRNDNDADRADFIELLIRLFLDGFYDFDEVVSLTEDMIDYDNGTVTFEDGRTIHPHERTFELLKINHGATTMAGYRQEYVMTSWRESYIRMPISASNVQSYNNRSKEDIRGSISRFIRTFFTVGQNIPIDYKGLYLLGFYEYLCETLGRERTNTILRTKNEGIKELRKAMHDYGFLSKNDVSGIRRGLLPYVHD